MLKNILLLLIVLIIVAAAITWVASGAPQEIARRAPLVSNPFAGFMSTTTQGGLRLPVYAIPEYIPLELPEFSEQNGEILSADNRLFEDPDFVASLERTLVDAEEEYDALRAELSDVRTFGEPSPYRDEVYFTTVSTGLGTETPSVQYVTIESARDLTAPITLTGWSLQSARSGARFPLPQATRTFVMGQVPVFAPVQLDPGAQATITTGVSPIGTSFRVNSCSGYLDQFQSFVPSLDTYSCPRPSDELPATLENYEAYGDACISFVSSLPSCHFYTNTFPSDISYACKAFVQQALTYNGCVERNRWRPSFVTKDWRLFLGQPKEVWAHEHDVIRLLDSAGRTVDVWSY